MAILRRSEEGTALRMFEKARLGTCGLELSQKEPQIPANAFWMQESLTDCCYLQIRQLARQSLQAYNSHSPLQVVLSYHRDDAAATISGIYVLLILQDHAIPRFWPVDAFAKTNAWIDYEAGSELVRCWKCLKTHPHIPTARC